MSIVPQVRRLYATERVLSLPLRCSTPTSNLALSGVIDSIWLSDCGEMAEWLKAHAWKACIPQGIQGSNPCLSAITSYKSPIINITNP